MLLPEEDDPLPPLSGEVGELRRSPNIKIAGNGVILQGKGESLQLRYSIGTSLEIDAEAQSEPISTVRFQSMSGMTRKQCPRILTMGLLWQSRFLSLQSDGALYYYYSRRDKEKGMSSLGVILLSDIRKERKSGKPKIIRTGQELLIGVHAKNRRNYRFTFDSEMEAATWEAALHSHL
jgi:PH domain